MLRRFLLVTVMGAALFACKDDLVLPPPADPGGSTTPNAPGGGGVTTRDASTPLTDGGSSSGNIDAGACTDLALAGSVVDENLVADNAPAGLGTTINDGTYNLTSVQVYGGASQLPGPTGDTYRSTIRITGGTKIERVLVRGTQAGASQETRASGVVRSVGVNVTFSLSCPTTTQEQLTFTANAPQLVLTDLVTKRQWTYQQAP